MDVQLNTVSHSISCHCHSFGQSVTVSQYMVNRNLLEFLAVLFEDAFELSLYVAMSEIFVFRQYHEKAKAAL